MPDYKKMYQTLVCETDTAISALSISAQTIQLEILRLEAALQEAERLYIEAAE